MQKKNHNSVYRIIADPSMTPAQKQAALGALPAEKPVSLPVQYAHRGSDFLFPGRKAYFARGDAAAQAAQHPAPTPPGRYAHPGPIATGPIATPIAAAAAAPPATMYQPTQDRVAATPLVFSSEGGGNFRTPDEQMQYVESVKNRPEPTPLYFDEGDNSFKEFGDEQPSDNRLARAAGGSE